MEKVGLIGGNGRLPVVFLQRARERGCRVYTLAVRGEAHRSVRALSEKCLVTAPGRLEAGARFFREHGVKRLVMLGQVLHFRLLRGGLDLDPALADLLARLPDRRAATLLGAVIAYFEARGFSFLPSSYLLEDHFLPPGTFYGPPLDERETASVALGRRVAETLAGLDVGLTVAVKDGIVLAVEALEGTNGTLRRAGRFTRGVIAVKVGRPDQDPRFDLPVIGPVTIRLLSRISARALAFSAGTLVVERERLIARAERAGISLAVF